MIGRNGERGSGISALAARQDDDTKINKSLIPKNDKVLDQPIARNYFFSTCE